MSVAREKVGVMGFKKANKKIRKNNGLVKGCHLDY